MAEFITHFAGAFITSFALVWLCYLMFTQLERKGNDDGEHRPAAQAVHSSPAQQSGNSPGAVIPFTPYQPSPTTLAILAQKNAISAAYSAYVARQSQLMQQAMSIPVGYSTAHVPPSFLDPWANVEPKDEGIKLGEIIAFRGWLLKDGMLRGARDNIWAPGEAMDGKLERTQNQQGSPGIYSFTKMRHAIQYWECDTGTTGAVFGRVALWGEVVEHAIGYRSEFAKIVALDSIGGDPNHPSLPELRKRYLLNAETFNG